MPIYDYKCSDCGKTYDVFHKVREVEADIVCPDCSSPKHVRLISAPSIRMKANSEYASESAPPCGDASRCGGVCSMN